LADSNGHGGVLSNVPIQFGCFGVDVDLPTVYKSAPLYNNDLVFAARVITHFQWAIYSFNSGHFAATSLTQALPFRVVLAADAFSEGRALLKEFAQCPLILNGAKELYDHVRKSGDTSKLDGYLIHSHRFPTSASTRTFWQLQASIISEMRKIRNLSLFVAFVHLDHDGRPVGLFAKALQSQGWVISDTFVYFPDFGDSVAGSSRLIIGVHSETDSTSQDQKIHVYLVTSMLKKPLPLLRCHVTSLFDVQDTSTQQRTDIVTPHPTHHQISIP
jgi:hypothetical protein